MELMSSNPACIHLSLSELLILIKQEESKVSSKVVSL